MNSEVCIKANNKTTAPRKQGFNEQRFDSQPTSGAAYLFLMQANWLAPASRAKYCLGSASLAQK